MTEKRSKTLKYKNFDYPENIKELLKIHLNSKDQKNIENIYINYESLNISRGYEYIISDLYILTQKHNLSTAELSRLYEVSIRTVQIWLKELGLNRDFKKAQKIAKARKNSDLISTIPKRKIKNQNLNIDSTRNFNFILNKDLPRSLCDFLNYLETIKGKSQNTINGYKIDLTLFFRFLKLYKGFVIDESLEFQEIKINDITDTFIKEISLMDIYSFLSFVEKNRGNSNYARARKVATLKSFFKFLYGKAKIIDENPTLDLESPKINKRHPVYLTLEQSIHLLNSLNKKDKNYKRDYCILTLFLNCGMRLSELCSIQLDKIKGDILTIIGKGNKERTVYLNDACLNSIEKYLSSRDISNVPLEYRNYLFISSRNRPINKRTVELLVKKHIENAGITDAKYTPHKLRHTAATLMYKHGNVDIRSLQNILGHENISTTQIYTHVDDEKLREAVKSNPLANIK